MATVGTILAVSFITKDKRLIIKNLIVFNIPIIGDLIILEDEGNTYHGMVVEKAMSIWDDGVGYVITIKENED